jgi:uncharacterized protein YbaR (Trm112 family)
MDKNLIDILVCPICKGSLEFKEDEIHCPRCHLAFPVRDDIPVMLESEARQLKSEKNSE